MPDKSTDNSKDFALSPLEESLKTSFYYPEQEDVMDDDPTYDFDTENGSLGSDPFPELPTRKKRARKGWRIFLVLLSICAVACLVIALVIARNRLAQAEEICIAESQKILQDYGLVFDRAKVRKYSGYLKNSYEADYYISGFTKLSYNRMYSVADKLDDLKFTYGNKTYRIYLNIIYSENYEYEVFMVSGAIYRDWKYIGDGYDSYVRKKPADSSAKKTQSVPGTYTPPSRKPYIPDEEEDEYNARDFSNPEDFYDEHYYDFFDYYDAEDYWYEHCE